MKQNDLLLMLLVAAGGYFVWQEWQKRQLAGARMTALISRTAAGVFGGSSENPFAITPRVIPGRTADFVPQLR